MRIEAKDGTVRAKTTTEGRIMSPEVARMIAARLIRAAEEAERQRGEFKRLDRYEEPL